jgi:hypothetical protein
VQRRALLTAGIAAPLWYMGVLLALGALRPGYDHARHVMSLLGEDGYSLAMAMNVLGFGALGLGLALFALGLRPAWPGQERTKIAALVALAGLAIAAVGALPCDPGCTEVTLRGRLHSPAASVAAAAMVGAMGLGAWDLARTPGGAQHAHHTLLLGMPALVGGLLYLLRVEPHIGAWQRLALAGPLAWVVLTAWVLQRRLRRSSP